MKNYKDFKSIDELADRILDKISFDGMDSLTDEETELLNKISKGEHIIFDEKPTKLDSDSAPLQEEKPPTDELRVRVFNLGRTVVNENKFEIGDDAYIINSVGDLPQYALDHLSTSDKFEVLRFNAKGKIDIGCHKRNENGKKVCFYFSTNRFSKTPYVAPELNDDDGDHVNIGEGKTPSDYSFGVLMEGEGPNSEDNPIMIGMTETDFDGCLDDQMGSHCLSQEVIDALNRGGIHGDCEAMESVWEVRDHTKSKQEIIDSMVEQGFIYDRGKE